MSRFGPAAPRASAPAHSTGGLIIGRPIRMIGFSLARAALLRSRPVTGHRYTPRKPSTPQPTFISGTTAGPLDFGGFRCPFSILIGSPGNCPRRGPDTCATGTAHCDPAMTCDRDRALLSCCASSGVRASELLGVTIGDVDWAGARVYVAPTGTRCLKSPRITGGDPVPAALPGRRMGYPALTSRCGGRGAAGVVSGDAANSPAGQRKSGHEPLHDVRHTASTRMADAPEMPFPTSRPSCGRPASRARAAI